MLWQSTSCFTFSEFLYLDFYTLIYFQLIIIIIIIIIISCGNIGSSMEDVHFLPDIKVFINALFIYK
jgi:hypothetical protein